MMALGDKEQLGGDPGVPGMAEPAWSRWNPGKNIKKKFQMNSSETRLGNERVLQSMERQDGEWL